MEQETLEEAAERLYQIYDRFEYDKDWVEDVKKRREDFIDGAKWQQERSYNEEELLEILASYADWSTNGDCTYYEWFKQFKR